MHSSGSYEEEGEIVDEGAAPGLVTTSVLAEELIPEKPENWNDMSKTQKKNHR